MIIVLIALIIIVSYFSDLYSDLILKFSSKPNTNHYSHDTMKYSRANIEVILNKILLNKNL